MPPHRVAIVRPGALEAARPTSDVAVVIDVLRFTTTVTVLFSREVGETRVLGSPGEARALPAEPRVLFSELSELADEPGRVDNSPVVAESVPLDDRAVVLVTRNGTRAVIAAVARARRVVLASFLNLHAVAGWVRGSGAQDVMIVPAGNLERNEARLEDDACAYALADLFAGRDPAFDRLFASVRADQRVRRRIDREPAFARDVHSALRTGVAECVPLAVGSGNAIRLTTAEHAS